MIESTPPKLTKEERLAALEAAKVARVKRAEVTGSLKGTCARRALRSTHMQTAALLLPTTFSMTLPRVFLGKAIISWTLVSMDIMKVIYWLPILKVGYGYRYSAISR